MKFTLSWLKDHLDTRASADEIAATLTKIGLEVESVAAPGDVLKPFVTAHILSAEKHPNADKLKLCMVDVGAGLPVQVVCGAPNARAGMNAVFAPPGTYIPGKDFTLDVGTIRGVESRGMLCAGAELQLSDESDGILELPADAPVGMSYAVYAQLDDAVFDIAITPNRPDCTGVRGIARDLAAAGLGSLIPDKPAVVTGTFPNPVALHIALGNKGHLCPAFAMRLVRDVKNGPAPDTIQRRLKSIGLRPINALVDITNYLTHDIARPLHVFDAAKIQGPLTVRFAKKGEPFEALDDKTYILDDTMVVIADDGGVQSLAGIMGGKATGCDEATRDVLIECALWDPLNIAQTGRKLGLHSDARYRFERGVDPQGVEAGLAFASLWALELCGGEASNLTLHDARRDDARAIVFPVGDVKRLTGTDFPNYEIKTILQDLGFWVSGAGSEWHVAPPSWRPDIHGKADLVEEVVRIAGMDRLTSKPLPRPGAVAKPVLTVLQKRRRTAQRVLAARGMMEAVTWSFMSQGAAQAFGGGKALLANPIAQDMDTLRPSLLPGLLAAAQRNTQRGYPDLALFEVGQIFFGAEPGEQSLAATGLRRSGTRHWQGADACDCFTAKADVLALLDACGLAPSSVQTTRDAPAWFHPTRSGTLRLGPLVLAHFGDVHPKILAQYDVNGRAAAFEAVLDTWPAPKAKSAKGKPLLMPETLQPLKRDFAFLVPEAVEAEKMLKTIRSVDKTRLAAVTLFDVYTGAGVAEGQRSLAIEVTINQGAKTLTDAEIEALSAKIIAAVTASCGAMLRA